MTSEWHVGHACPPREKCWRQPDSGGACLRCGQPWPRCLSLDGLACLTTCLTGMIDNEEIAVLNAEIVRRGLEPVVSFEVEHATPPAATGKEE